jgi:hypothetical protein
MTGETKDDYEYEYDYEYDGAARLIVIVLVIVLVIGCLMSTQIVPIPKVDLSFRTATKADFPALDALQKQYGRALGYFPTKQFEEYIEMGAVLVAEQVPPVPSLAGDAERTGTAGEDTGGTRLGYIISRDRYLKRDELGVIFQLCVATGAQRKLVGASLVGEAFRRSAYGCRLYCLWCAQDLDANYFWESLGFVPIAFRSGSDKKKRVHIFWQKRICEGDSETLWWYPYQTSGGAIRADRIVWPIPTGVHWKDVRAIELPGTHGASAPRRCLPRPKTTAGETPAARSGPGPGMVGILVSGRIKYIPRPGYVAPALSEKNRAPRERAPKPTCPERSRSKCDPAFLAKARELRDRWLEHVNSGQALIESAGKYDVARQRHLSATALARERLPLLPAA